MKAYWDTSALIQATLDAKARAKVEEQKPYTRTHSLAEAFSALTGGNLAIRLKANDAAASLETLCPDLQFIDLASTEVLAAFKSAEKKGVRGGAVHDFLHAIAADKIKATEFVTMDSDFSKLGLTTLPVKAP